MQNVLKRKNIHFVKKSCYQKSKHFIKNLCFRPFWISAYAYRSENVKKKKKMSMSAKKRLFSFVEIVTFNEISFLQGWGAGKFFSGSGS